jgi:hypothetical protein
MHQTVIMLFFSFPPAAFLLHLWLFLVSVTCEWWHEADDEPLTVASILKSFNVVIANISH